METIEERAKAFSEEQNACDICDGKGRYCPCGNFTADYDMYFKIATEQDRISRAEERERCIRMACNGFGKSYCNFEHTNGTITCNGYNFDRCKDCYRTEKIRKAIEGGEG